MSGTTGFPFVTYKPDWNAVVDLQGTRGQEAHKAAHADRSRDIMRKREESQKSLQKRPSDGDLKDFAVIMSVL